MTNIENHIEYLGYTVEDKVTGFKGVVDSVCFDLYGCIQCSVKPMGVTKEGMTFVGHWFDIRRLKILSKKRKMDVPDFNLGYQAEGRQGAADKPLLGK